MRKTVSIVGYPVCGKDVMKALGSLRDPSVLGRFMDDISRLTQSKAVFAANSGNACFYVILKTLKELIPEKTEVVLPAYTASSLVVTIRKAGLIPVLCDISLDDFNADLESALKAVTRRTLCVLAVHMFGIPWLNIIKFKRRMPPGTIIIEDGAQALGACINSIPIGLFGDVAFFSFNRGKNLPTLTGGIATTFNPALVAHLRGQAEVVLRPRGFLKELIGDVQCAALRLAFDPAWYGVLNFLIARFKEKRTPLDIPLETYSRFQAGFGLSLLGRWEKTIDARYRNGLFLQRALSQIDGVIVPKEEAGVQPAFNRMPIVFKKAGHVDHAMRQLDAAGIESSRMYDRPLHHIFHLGNNQNDFPNAVFLAQNLLTLPVHPLVEQSDLEKMVEIVREVARS